MVRMVPGVVCWLAAPRHSSWRRSTASTSVAVLGGNDTIRAPHALAQLKDGKQRSSRFFPGASSAFLSWNLGSWHLSYALPRDAGILATRMIVAAFSG